MKVTAKTIESLPNGVHRVDTGLYLRKRDGRKSMWLYVYYFDGKRREMSLGTVEKVSITLARDLANKYKTLLAKGLDPVLQRKEQRKRQTTTQENKETFEQFFERVAPDIVLAKQWRSQKRELIFYSSIRRYSIPFIGSMKLEEITKEHILSVLKPIWIKKNPTASLALTFLNSLFKYAIANGEYHRSNPCSWSELSVFLPSPQKVHRTKHHQALTVEETRKLISMELLQEQTMTKAALLFGVLTCTRKGEFSKALWEEIDLEQRVWSIPPERRKDGKPYVHRIPLSYQVIELLKNLPRVNDFIFPGRNEGKTVSNQNLTHVLRKMYPGATIHGFRSTFRDWAAENEIDWAVAEKCLMHTVGNAVVQSYLRTDLLEKRRVVMQQWADTLFQKVEK